MKPLFRQLALAGLFLLSAGAAPAAVTVTYIHPETFTDLPFTPWERAQTLKDLAAHLEKLGKTLPAGEDLKIDVLDIDLAGREEPSVRRAQEIRILRGGADWPHIHLRYTLESGGKVVRRGDEQLSDMMYMGRLTHYADGDMLRYEKRMLDDWFRKTFAPAQAVRK